MFINVWIVTVLIVRRYHNTYYPSPQCWLEVAFSFNGILTDGQINGTFNKPQQ
jgi:hypothetical protein